VRIVLRRGAQGGDSGGDHFQTAVLCVGVHVAMATTALMRR
jgi:hypothetical protein